MGCHGSVGVHAPLQEHKAIEMSGQIFFSFTAKAAADAAADAIVENVRAWLEVNAPSALSEDGSKLRGRNAGTGELVDVFTDCWAVPQQTLAGKWVFPKPTQDKTAPIPVSVFLAGIQATEAEWQASWFPEPPPPGQ